MYRTLRVLHKGNEFVNEYVHLLFSTKPNAFANVIKNAFALVLNLSVLMHLEFSPRLNVLLLYIISTWQGLAFQRKTYVHIRE